MLEVRYRLSPLTKIPFPLLQCVRLLYAVCIDVVHVFRHVFRVRINARERLCILCYVYYVIFKPCTDRVVVLAISLFPEVPGLIPERRKK